MSFKTIISIVSLLALTLPATAQLRSVGAVPADLKQSVEELYSTDLQRAKDYTGGRVRDRQTLLEASYHINKMLSGGHIIYGDPLSAMVSRIADTLLKDYPELRKELRFYTVTSSDVNAFTTPQGLVFINTGLIAQVEDEAQLAFILSHEIVHYYRSHGLEDLVGKDGKRRRSDNLDDEAANSGDFLRYHKRSREKESEADSLGIAMFYLGSPYAKDVSEGVFDVLQYSELPFDEIAFDTTWFNTPYYKVEGCWLPEVAAITSRDNYDDSRSTHPNILSRRQRTAATLYGHTGGKRYVTTTQEEFSRLRHMARLESIRQDLLHGHFAKAFYNSWVLRQDNDETLDRYMVQALYGMATFKNNEKQADVLDDYKKIEGESQQICYAMRTMTKEQITLAALHKTWEMHLRHPEDEAYTAISNDLMEQLRTKIGKSVVDYLSIPPAESDEQQAKSETQKEDNKPDAPKTKYERIKQKRQEQTQRTPTAYALTDLMMQDPTLQPSLRDHLNGTAKSPTLPDATTDSAAMLVFNPSYWVVDSKKDQLLVNKSISKENALGERIKNTAAHFGRRTVDFSDNSMHGMVSDTQYNDFLTICEWMNEFWLTKGRFGLERVMQPAMNDLLNRHDARMLNMTALLNIQGQSDGFDAIYLFAIPFIPLILESMMNEHEHTTMVGLVVDAREGKLMTREAYSADVNDAPSMVDAMLYDTYRKTMNPDKKAPVGHLGHRLSITGGVNLGISGKQPWSQLGKHVALTPWVAMEFAINRKKSLFASARYHSAYEDVTQEVGYYTSDNNYHTKDVHSSMNMLTIAAGMRIYRKSEFAPLGRYLSIAAMLTHYSSPFEGSFRENSDNTFGVSLGIGQNFIFLDRLVLNYEIDYAWTFGYMYNEIKNFSYENIINIHRADGLLSSLISIRLGLGIIPF